MLLCKTRLIIGMMAKSEQKVIAGELWLRDFGLFDQSIGGVGITQSALALGAQKQGTSRLSLQSETFGAVETFQRLTQSLFPCVCLLTLERLGKNACFE